MESARGEGPRVTQTVEKLIEVFARDPFGRMTVVAHCRLAVAGPNPTVKLLPHDMTVCTGLGLISEIGPSFRVDESETANPDSETDSNARNYRPNEF